TCPATQSGLCGSYTAPQKMHDILTRLAKCRVDTRPGQCGASNLQGGNHTYPYSETIRDLPVRCAQGAGVRISKVWKTQVISRPQETGKRGRKFSRLFCLWSYTVTGADRACCKFLDHPDRLVGKQLRCKVMRRSKASGRTGIKQANPRPARCVGREEPDFRRI